MAKGARRKKKTRRQKIEQARAKGAGTPPRSKYARKAEYLRRVGKWGWEVPPVRRCGSRV